MKFIGRPSKRLLKKAQTQLAQLCVQYPAEGVVFELSAKLLENEPLQQAQKLQKAYRAYTQVWKFLKRLRILSHFPFQFNNKNYLSLDA